MQLIALQTATVWHDPAANRAAVAAMLAEACPPPGSLVVLPETFAAGFSSDTAQATAEAEETQAFLAGEAAARGIAITAGLAVKAGACAANESVTWGPDGRELSRYRKLQPFTPAGEHVNYPAGDRVVTFEFGGLTIAPFICYDLRFPEIFRAAVDRGAELFTVIGNWPNRRHQHWTTLLKARAIENQAAVIGVNRAGSDPEFTYGGGSLILGPQAEVLAEAGDAACCIRADFTPQTVRDWRAQFPALRDRRRDYHQLSTAPQN
jgi:omega-amidase